jgi:hypothetical protein
MAHTPRAEFTIAPIFLSPFRAPGEVVLDPRHAIARPAPHLLLGLREPSASITASTISSILPDPPSRFRAWSVGHINSK